MYYIIDMIENANKNNSGRMNMISDFTKQYYANIKANQIKAYCVECKKRFYIFPEDKGRAICACGTKLK
jgi:hypothetical protein